MIFDKWRRWVGALTVLALASPGALWGEMVLPPMQRKLPASSSSAEAKMIDEQLVDKEGFWSAYYVNRYLLGWNTKLVKRDDVPKT